MLKVIPSLIFFIFMITGISSRTEITYEFFKCIKDYKNIPKFNLTRFATGRWYVYKSYSLYGNGQGSCAYGDFNDGNYSKFNARLNNHDEAQEQTIKYSEMQWLANTTNEGLGNINFNKNDSPFRIDFFLQVPGTFMKYRELASAVIIGTDYNNFGVVYLCGFLGQMKIKDLFILSRSGYELDQSSVSRVRNIIKANKLNKLSLKESPVKDCNNY